MATQIPPAIQESGAKSITFGVDSSTATKAPDRDLVPSLKGKPDHGNLVDPVSGRLLIPPRELRNACKCPRCVHPSDRQRNYHWAEIPLDIDVAHHEIDADGIYSVHWKNDVPGFENHVSQYTKQDITEAGSFKDRHGQSIHKQAACLWDRSNLNVSQSSVTYKDFMETTGGLAIGLHNLIAYGLLFVNNIPKDEESVARLAERIGPLRNTFYGRTWDVRSVAQAKNVAYTSRNLGYHMDLLYMTEPPGLQLLHCLENTCEGGLSRFADTFKALDNLINKQGKSVISHLSSLQVAYEYYNDGSYYYDKKPIAQLLDSGMVRRNIRNAQNPELVAQVHRIYWSPPFTAPHMTALPKYREKELITAKAFADALEEEEMTVTTKLPPGTCAIFDNLRVVHARTAFDTTSGHRWLKGAYIDHQDFWSKAAAMEKEISEIDTST